MASNQRLVADFPLPLVLDAHRAAAGGSSAACSGAEPTI